MLRVRNVGSGEGEGPIGWRRRDSLQATEDHSGALGTPREQATAS
jgi:hypothetical protein